MKSTTGLTLLEIMLAVLIMAFAILPIADMLTQTSKSTKFERSESEAMQFACDVFDKILMKMDFDDPNIASPTEVFLVLKQTEILYSIEVTDVPMPNPYKNFVVPTILHYHDPCPGGIEAISTLSAMLLPDQTLSIYQLDKEKLPSGSGVDLKDIKMVVKWRPRGSNNADDYNRHPINLFTRKARL
ncbi:MAG: hypothetical protein HQM08_27565 [Candidatus Riflebacteria bacterium]|nr:hypothetical protein [Candidatus Riflebacteria bacterium]